MKDSHPWLRKVRGAWVLPLVTALVLLIPATARAADSGDFSIQVSPSPLVVTLKPGVTQTATFTVRNLSSHSETLVPLLTAISVSSDSKQISLKNTPPIGLRDWISFDQSSLVVNAGGSKQLSVIYKTPQDVGFSYSLAITLNRAASPDATRNGASYKASVAVFNLINIDRPDARRQLSISSFAANKTHYEFLPADFTLMVKNSGNVNVQPTGTVFIQRSFDSSKPIAAMSLNESGGYILPTTARELKTSWSEGFPVYLTTAGTNNETTRHLSWDWGKVHNLRFGKYVAKVVLVYNDGQRDESLVASYSFWVIPWRLIFAALFLIAIIVGGIVGWGKIIARGTGKLRKKYATRKH